MGRRRQARKEGVGAGLGESWSPLHTADNQQQLGHALQVETVGAVLGDVPRLRGTYGEKEEAVIMWPASRHQQTRGRSCTKLSMMLLSQKPCASWIALSPLKLEGK